MRSSQATIAGQGVGYERAPQCTPRHHDRCHWPGPRCAGWRGRGRQSPWPHPSPHPTDPAGQGTDHTAKGAACPRSVAHGPGGNAEATVGQRQPHLRHPVPLDVRARQSPLSAVPDPRGVRFAGGPWGVQSAPGAETNGDGTRHEAYIRHNNHPPRSHAPPLGPPSMRVPSPPGHHRRADHADHHHHPARALDRADRALHDSSSIRIQRNLRVRLQHPRARVLRLDP